MTSYLSHGITPYHALSRIITEITTFLKEKSLKSLYSKNRFFDDVIFITCYHALSRAITHYHRNHNIFEREKFKVLISKNRFFVDVIVITYYHVLSRAITHYHRNHNIFEREKNTYCYIA